LALECDLNAGSVFRALIMDKKILLADYHALDVLDHVLGRVTHKFSNLICPVLGFSEILVKMNKDEALREFIEHTYDYSTELRAFNDFLGASDLLSSTSLQSRVTPYSEAFLKSYRDALIFLTGVTPNFPSKEDAPLCLRHDPGALEAVMTHIICNALEAGAEADSLQISCKCQNLSDDVGQMLNLSPGDYGQFTLSGPSPAASPEALRQALHPLYTTKDISRHKGMGLWHSYRLMRRMGGTILFFNAPDRRTCVSLLLPLLTDRES
jgi:signal transduction histidine kinase